MSITGRVGPDGCERASGAGMSGKRGEKSLTGIIEKATKCFTKHIAPLDIIDF